MDVNQTHFCSGNHYRHKFGEFDCEVRKSRRKQTASAESWHHFELVAGRNGPMVDVNDSRKFLSKLLENRLGGHQIQMTPTRVLEERDVVG